MCTKLDNKILKLKTNVLFELNGPILGWPFFKGDLLLGQWPFIGPLFERWRCPNKWSPGVYKTFRDYSKVTYRLKISQFGIKILRNVFTSLSRQHLFTYGNKPSYLEFGEEFRLIIYYSFVKNVKLNNFVMYHKPLNVIKLEIMRFVYFQVIWHLL